MFILVGLRKEKIIWRTKSGQKSSKVKYILVYLVALKMSDSITISELKSAIQTFRWCFHENRPEIVVANKLKNISKSSEQK